ncbi:MAG TPA: hypothetical protein VEZ14_04335 [Dehalococcoidia bacterium]|nr:hypothetical protein [Dehalococcoidia bacterium]
MSQRIDKATYYRDVRMVPYDLVKELVLASLAVLIVVVVLAAALSSPDVPSLTIARWSAEDPVDFVTTATAELSGSSTSAQYGPPYNNGSGAVQHLWFLRPQEWLGVHYTLDTAQQFVLQPLQQAAAGDAAVASALSTFNAANDTQRSGWYDAYTAALANATAANGAVSVAAGDYGPLPVLMNRLLGLAQSGALDGLLLVNGNFYETDYTKPLLYMGDGGYIGTLAQQQKLTGSQWGMMNETGRYPGQTWLWLFTMWYQVAPFNRAHGFLGVNAANADLSIIVLMTFLSAMLVLVPFIPGLRDIPRWIPVHRLIWRHYYAELRSGRAPPTRSV